jgi:hypothetical protein
MTWTLKPKGSWGEATSSAPGTDFPAALALPGTWHWYPGATTLLVRKDQWGSLAATPGVDSITPNYGTAAGGTGVTIAGEGLTGSTGVTFGGTAATGFTVVNDGFITCVTPAHATGTVAVVVANPRGNVTIANGYTYS